jgi:hypothetical protein
MHEKELVKQQVKKILTRVRIVQYQKYAITHQISMRKQLPEVKDWQSTFGISSGLETELFFLWLAADVHAWFNNVWVVMPEFLSSI